MNGLLIAVGIIFIACMIIGYVRGFIKIVASLATTIAVLILTFVLTPYVSNWVQSSTSLDELVQKKCIQAMSEVATSSGIAADAVKEAGITAADIKAALENEGLSEDMLTAAGISIDDIVNGKVSFQELEKFGISKSTLDVFGISEKEVEDKIKSAEIPRKTQVEAIKKADIPSIFQKLLLDNNNSEIYNQLGVSTFGEYVGAYLSKLIVGIVAFLATFVILTIIARIIIYAVGIIADLPVINGVNRVAGAGLGVATALIIVWMLFIIITLLYVTSFGKSIFNMIDGNAFLSFIYDNNPLLKLATMFRG